MPKARSDNTEYTRGYERGREVGAGDVKRYGKATVADRATELKADARKPSADAFDRGYFTGYTEALQ